MITPRAPTVHMEVDSDDEDAKPSPTVGLKVRVLRVIYFIT